MAGIDNNTLLYLRGDSFKDLSPNNISIIDSNVVINNGINFFDTYLDFQNESNSSADKYLNLGKLNFDANSDFTIEFIINFTSYDSNMRSIINSNGSGQVWTDFANAWQVGISNGTVYFTNTVANSSWIIRSSSSLESNKFYHVQLTRKDNYLYLFIDGKLNNKVSVSNYSFANNNFFIGRSDVRGIGCNAKLLNFRLSNIARCSEDFTPPTKPYNSITINKTNQTDTNIEFNIEKLGQETINKVEVLVNGIVSETYTDGYDSIDYLIDTELCVIGNNDITIRVTFDEIYTEELSLTHNITIDELPLETPLLDTVERVKLLTKSKQNEKTILSSILTSKNVEVSEEDKMSDLIGKVDMLGEYDDGKLWLYKDGVENIQLTNYPTTYGATMTKKSNVININCNTKSSSAYVSYLGLYNVDKLNLSSYNKLKVEFSGQLSAGSYGEDGGSVIMIGTDDNINNLWNPSVQYKYICPQSQTVNFEKQIFELNISNINKETYVCVSCLSGATNKPLNYLDIDIHKIWLEK